MLRGFSGFEQMFRSKMAKSAPTDVLVAKKVQEGNTAEEIAVYRATFKKFDTDGGGSIDSEELGKLIRVLGLVLTLKSLSSTITTTNTNFLKGARLHRRIRFDM